MKRLLAWNKRQRRGSPTVEFILLVPLFIMCLLMFWQLVILGMAMMQTQAAVRDTARVMALTDDEVEAKAQAHRSLPDMMGYQMEKLWLKKTDGQVEVKIRTEVELVLLQVPYRFHLEEKASAPIVHQQKQTIQINQIPVIEHVP